MKSAMLVHSAFVSQRKKQIAWGVALSYRKGDWSSKYETKMSFNFLNKNENLNISEELQLSIAI
ncbi:hypothetical protein HN51_055840 [Arachis hypogaea]